MNVKNMRLIAAGAVMAGLISVVPAMAQAGAVQSGQSISAPADGAAHNWTPEQLVTSTVHEAWVLSGRNEDQFFEMVKELLEARRDSMSRNDMDFMLREYSLNLERQLDWTQVQIRDLRGRQPAQHRLR